MQQEVEHLRFLLTSDSIRTQQQQKEVMTRIKLPTYSKQHERFFGMVHFYQDVWSRRLHILVLLLKLSSKTGK